MTDHPTKKRGRGRPKKKPAEKRVGHGTAFVRFNKAEVERIDGERGLKSRAAVLLEAWQRETRLVELLRGLEWDIEDQCPSCRAFELDERHADDCRLAALLTEMDPAG